ncbi:MAG: MmgE/PrpD family protein [Rhodobacteraceae bacterium]|nr:MmgE/PrpD family protein [Paracoccaceae bacterium]
MTDTPIAAASPGAIAERLADAIARLRPEDVPDAVHHAVANTVLDTIGLSIASVGTDYGRAVRAANPGTGPCTAFGAEAPADPFSAALINGTTGHGEDYDNTYEGCPVHTGVVIVPALFAAGEAYGLPSDRVAFGMAVGIEVICRLGAVAHQGVHSAGFHPTSVLGTLGAAAGIAAARGFDARQITDTLGVAGSMASGIIEYLADGSWTKRMHAGWAAQSGLRAATMGAAGFRGPVSVIEGSHGLFRAFAPSTRPDYEAILQDFGTRWEAARVAFKPYACGTMTQPFIDCAVRLARRGIKAEAIEEVICYVGEGTVHRLWEPLALKQRPPTAYAAKFSGPYCVAAGFTFGDAGLAQFTETTIRDPQVLSLCGRVRFEVDPADGYPLNYSGHVALRLKDGTVVEERQPQLRGGTREPLTRGDLLAKCAANLAFGGWLTGRAADLARFADGLAGTAAPFSAAAFRR